jgi:hypothetical protein
MDRRSFVVGATLVLATACGGESALASDSSRPAEPDPTQPPRLESKWRGSMDVSPDRVRPGEQIAIRLSDDGVRGIAFSLDAWEESRWRTQFYLTSDGGSLHWTPSWWSIEDSEGRGWVDIGVGGPEPDHVIIPDIAPAGTYRLCTANTHKKACALVTVVPE